MKRLIKFIAGPAGVVVALSTIAPAARAQLSITATTIVDGEAGVTPSDSVHITFTFSDRLPFNSLFTTKFHWEPVGAWQRPYVFLDADRQNPRFTLIHRPETDFAAYVFGVAAQNGARMARPFAMNYSTLPSMGTHDVSGSVSLGTRTPSSASASIARLVHNAHASPERSASRALGIDGDDQLVYVRTMDRLQSASKHLSLSSNLADENFTVVLLLDDYDINDLTWSVRAAAAVQPGGSFLFSHIRDGTYYPVAINWTDNTGDVVGSYGYYDADGDYAPDPVVVSGGNVMDVDVTIYPYETATGLEHRFLAEDAAIELAPDAVLVASSAPNVATDGHAVEWTYTFYSSSLSQDIAAVVDPLTIATFMSPSSLTIAPAGVPTSGIIDSDEAVNIADANGGSDFRASHESVSVSARGGYALDAFPDSPDDLVWTVTYVAGAGSPDPPLEIHVDMMDGSIKSTDRIDLARTDFRIRGVYPNPFRAQVAVELSLDAPDLVLVDAIDLLGRRVGRVRSMALPAGVHTLQWGSDLASGIYILRVQTDDRVETRRVVKIGD